MWLSAPIQSIHLLFLSCLLSWTLVGVAGQLNPSCAPGGNFDLSGFQLEMPIGTTNNPTVKTPAQLQGCQGYSDPKYFYTDKNDGAMVMYVPGDPASTGCVKWKESDHCRTELGQVSDRWDPRKPHNRMTATLAVTAAGGRTCVGQVFHDNPLKPSAEIYYDDDGQFWVGVARTRAGGNQVPFNVGKIPLGQKFTYQISWENNVLGIKLDDGALQVLDTFDLNAPESFFKIGNYLQGTKPSTVRFYDIKISHSDADDPGTCDAAPEIVDPWVVNLRFYDDAQCCKAVLTQRAGTLDKCNNMSVSPASFKQAVGQEMFNRNIQISLFEGTDCQRTEEKFFLTNKQQCWVKAQPQTKWKSFKISASS